MSVIELVPTTGDLTAVETFDEWLILARASYAALVDDLAALEPDDWARPTPCEGWDVRAMAGHVLGAMRSGASVREMLSQQRVIGRRVKQTGQNQVDVMTALQIELTAGLSPAQVVDEMRGLVDRAATGRGRLPGVVRRAMKIPVEMGTIAETWNMEYLLGRILTRDTFLHRVDLADALGTAPKCGDAERRIVGDVAVEWASRHRQPVELRLTGDAGGDLTAGDGGPVIEIDALQFCRVLSGRAQPGHPLLGQEVPF